MDVLFKDLCIFILEQKGWLDLEFKEACKNNKRKEYSVDTILTESTKYKIVQKKFRALLMKKLWKNLKHYKHSKNICVSSSHVLIIAKLLLLVVDEQDGDELSKLYRKWMGSRSDSLTPDERVKIGDGLEREISGVCGDSELKQRMMQFMSDDKDRIFCGRYTDIDLTITNKNRNQWIAFLKDDVGYDHALLSTTIAKELQEMQVYLYAFQSVFANDEFCEVDPEGYARPRADINTGKINVYETENNEVKEKLKEVFSAANLGSQEEFRNLLELFMKMYKEKLLQKVLTRIMVAAQEIKENCAPTDCTQNYDTNVKAIRSAAKDNGRAEICELEELLSQKSIINRHYYEILVSDPEIVNSIEKKMKIKDLLSYFNTTAK